MTLPELRPIPGFPGYLAGDDGHVYSTKWHRTHRLCPAPNAKGYPQLHLRTASGTYKTLRVHRFVALAFLPPRPTPQHEMRHIDGDRLNNRPSNLAWGTQAENRADMERHGTQVRGERVGGAKLTVQDVRRIRQLLMEGAPKKALARQFGIKPSTIRASNDRKSWRHVA